ncbi:VPS3 [Acanthosepion pharaonis]|uniref:VPS3 n=1 Tax=Acanthosepion pharaonis TaxID=158019 RepID=A0A812BCT3_ACAPH|nr:VPS3 [Sepia pharaonis]
MHAECAILYGKLEEHEKALKILVHKLKDYTAAETYCLVNAKDGAYKRKLFHILLSVYLDPSYEKKDTLIAPAIALLNSNVAEFDSVKVLQLLPENWSVGLLSQFLSRSVRRSMNLCRTKKIERMLARWEALQMKHNCIDLQKESVCMTEDRLCAVCNRTFHDSTFLRYPNGVITHIHCAKNRNVCPFFFQCFPSLFSLHLFLCFLLSSFLPLPTSIFLFSSLPLPILLLLFYFSCSFRSFLLLLHRVFPLLSSPSPPPLSAPFFSFSTASFRSFLLLLLLFPLLSSPPPPLSAPFFSSSSSFRSFLLLLLLLFSLLSSPPPLFPSFLLLLLFRSFLLLLLFPPFLLLLLFRSFLLLLLFPLLSSPPPLSAPFFSSSSFRSFLLLLLFPLLSSPPPLSAPFFSSSSFRSFLLLLLFPLLSSPPPLSAPFFSFLLLLFPLLSPPPPPLSPGGCKGHLRFELHLLTCHLLLTPLPPPPLYFLKHLFPFSSHFSPPLHLLFISSTLSCKLFSIIPAYFPFLLPPPLSYLAFSSFFLLPLFFCYSFILLNLHFQPLLTSDFSPPPTTIPLSLLLPLMICFYLC